MCIAIGSAGCTETPIQVPLNSLSSAGPVSFVCLGSPGERLEDFSRPLSDCTSTRIDEADDYAIPHLYALVTQTLTGEVALVDLTTNSGSVIDQDASVPGSNFLPIGALPTDIVSTPGSMASFVAVSETNFEAIYALPSDMIRATNGSSAPRLSSWPACALPATPGRIVLAIDPADSGGAIRPGCDLDYGDVDPDAECTGADGEVATHCHGDLSNDAAKVGTPGRYKLIVALPSEGGLAVIDAQDILDQEAGAREPCNIERFLPLDVALPPLPTPPPPPQTDACAADNIPDSDPFAKSYTSQPAHLVLDGDQLYVADRGAPVIHRLDMATPCDPFELPPLVTYSADDPSRPVFTSRIAVSPLTLDLKRFLYAIDVIDGSVMMFDISDGSTLNLPLIRDNAVFNPSQPLDRLRFNAPPRDVVILQYQNDANDDVTGSTVPIRCEPTGDGPGATYRTSDNFESGARPTRLRGVFAFIMLTSGDVVVIDIDDYDAPCRGPRDAETRMAQGCSAPEGEAAGASDEYTCNVVVPHQTRAQGFLITRDGIANNEPGLQSLPILNDADGTIIQPDDMSTAPRMRAPSGANSVIVGNDRELFDDQGCWSTTRTSTPSPCSCSIRGRTSSIRTGPCASRDPCLASTMCSRSSSKTATASC